jgi:hypothetical protein
MSQRVILILSHKLIDKICRGPDGGTVRAAHLPFLQSEDYKQESFLIDFQPGRYL